VPTAPPTIGTRLREARVNRSLSIEETAWRTRIRPDLLRALELGEFDAIGHQASVRSHLRSYARFLGMNPAEVVGEFEALAGDVPSALQELDRQERTARKPPRAKWLIAAIVCGSLLAGAGVAGVLGGQAERPSEDAAALASLAPRPTHEEASRTREVLPPVPSEVRLAITALADVKVAVAVDGRQIFDGVIPAGTTRVYAGKNMVAISAADPSTIRLQLNGKPVSTGGPGGMYRARFGPRGQITG